MTPTRDLDIILGSEETAANIGTIRNFMLVRKAENNICYLIQFKRFSTIKDGMEWNGMSALWKK